MSIVKKDLTCQWVMPREFSSLTPLSALRKTFRSSYLLDLSLFENEASFEAEYERALVEVKEELREKEVNERTIGTFTFEISVLFWWKNVPFMRVTN